MHLPLKACVFDAYGTLFDVHAPISLLAQDIGADATKISALWRNKQLEYTWLRSLMGRYVDFSQITADALDYALATHGIEDNTLRNKLLDLYSKLEAFEDAAPCLQKLRDAKIKSGILSNGSPKMLASAVTSAQLGSLLDYILSVDTAQIYKPSPSVYQLAVNAFGVSAQEIGFVSANGWDCAGASAFGFYVIHVNRYGHQDERLDAFPRATVSTLKDAADLFLSTQN